MKQENEGNMYLELARAFGHVKIIPQYFPYRNQSLENRFETLAEGVQFYFPYPKEIVGE